MCNRTWIYQSLVALTDVFILSTILLGRIVDLSEMDTSIVDMNSQWPANNDVGCPPCNKSVACPLPSEQAGVAPMASSSTLGRHLARRLVEVGITDVFSVPGDFNLTLLDHLLAEPGLNLIGCCNELNAGYAADGYARSRGVGACAVTFTVGGLSIINAIAGAYSENLPVICIVGGPNSNDYGTNRILHHTIGVPDFSQEYRCFRRSHALRSPIECDVILVLDCMLMSFLSRSKGVRILKLCRLL
jgi:pyruvate decarboxylase